MTQTRPPAHTPTSTPELSSVHQPQKSRTTAERSPTRAKPHDLTRRIPALQTRRPQRPLHLTIWPPRMNSPAQTTHRCPQRDMTIAPVDGMSLLGERKPDKGMRLRERCRHDYGTPHSVLLGVRGHSDQSINRVSQTGRAGTESLVLPRASAISTRADSAHVAATFPVSVVLSDSEGLMTVSVPARRWIACPSAITWSATR
jgi:hypothetical protein